MFEASRCIIIQMTQESIFNECILEGSNVKLMILAVKITSGKTKLVCRPHSCIVKAKSNDQNIFIMWDSSDVLFKAQIIIKYYNHGRNEKVTIQTRNNHNHKINKTLVSFFASSSLYIMLNYTIIIIIKIIICHLI